MAAEPATAGTSTPPLAGWPLASLPARVKVALLLVAVGLLTIAGVVASREYPRPGLRDATELERQIIAVFRDPAVEVWDETLIGDLLVERFYIADVVTGERYVADLLKGRIDGIEVVPREDQPEAAVYLLKSREMRRDKAFFNAYLKAVVDPAALPGRYLGAVMPSGDSDAFPVNYTGELPAERWAFAVGDFSDPYAYALRQDYREITAPRGINVRGYIYVLNTSDLLPVFKSEFGLGKTVFVSELLVVDATARDNKVVYFRLLDQYPRSPNP
ncbi:MAG TPA: hypothetical protein VNN10_16125 [Dehalococcoidia bacterium]|nr:hypothetical protein [Dehalococcoidia bacterium]